MSESVNETISNNRVDERKIPRDMTTPGRRRLGGRRAISSPSPRSTILPLVDATTRRRRVVVCLQIYNGPAARHRPTPSSVAMLPSLTAYTDEDATTIERETSTKRLDANVRIVGVAARTNRDVDVVSDAGGGAVRTTTPAGAPRVLMCYPLRIQHDMERSATRGFSTAKWACDAETRLLWPNLFWLTCPEALRRVGRLEHNGRIRSFQERIHEDEAARAVFNAQHARFAALRWGTLTDEDRAWCEERGGAYVEALRDRGIGGYYSYDQVKCLHVHYAHYLATGDNIVGEWVQELLDAGEDGEAAREQTEKLNASARPTPSR